MIAAFFLALTRLPELLWYSFSDYRNLFPLRLIVIILAIPVLGLYLAYSWLGFLLDEILFPGYRRVKIQKPVFVLGVPRSGTTFLHRTLAKDQQYTTFKTWECLFAPAIVHRKFFLAIGWLDAKFGQPLFKTLNAIENLFISWMDDIHKVSLDEAEEDYFVFLPILHFFLLVMLFPNDKTLWKMGTFDRDLSDLRKRILLRYYHLNLKKHMYVFGRDKILLSKNASFAAMANSLHQEFSNARFFYCSRDAREALASQISSVVPAMKLFRTESSKTIYVDKFHKQFLFFYQYLEEFYSQADRTYYQLAPMSQFKEHLYEIIRDGYRNMNIELHDDFVQKLKLAAERASRFSSSHNYDLTFIGLDAQQIAKEFAFAKHLY